MMVTVYDRIVDGFGIGGNLGGVARVFYRVNKLKMVSASRFPMDVAAVAVKAYGEG